MPLALGGESASFPRSPVWTTCAAIMSGAASAGRVTCVTAQPAAKAAAIDNMVAVRFMVRPPLTFLVPMMLGPESDDGHGRCTKSLSLRLGIKPQSARLPRRIKSRLLMRVALPYRAVNRYGASHDAK